MKKGITLNKRVREIEAEIERTEAAAKEAAERLAKLKARREEVAKAPTLNPTEVRAKLDQINALFKELERNAELSGETFSFGLTYGMGGTFGPDFDNPDVWRWRSSSEGC